MMNFLIDSKSIEDDVIEIQSRYLSDSILSDIDFQKWPGSELPLKVHFTCRYSSIRYIGDEFVLTLGIRTDRMSCVSNCIFWDIFELDNRATSMDFLKPKEAKAKLDPRDGWLFKLKSKFTEDEMLFLEEEFDDLECIGMIRENCGSSLLAVQSKIKWIVWILGIKIDVAFLYGPFFISDYWNWLSKLCWFWEYKKFDPIPWEFEFENFAQNLKLRGLRQYA